MSRDISKFKNALDPANAGMAGNMGGMMSQAQAGQASGWDKWDDQRLDPRNRSRRTDTAHESQAASVAQRADPYATIGGGDAQKDTQKLLQAMTFERTMEKAARDVAKSMEQEMADEGRGDGRRAKKRDKRLNEDGEEMSSGEEDEADAAKDKDLDLDELRAKRLEAMKKKQKEIQDQRAKGHGSYDVITQDEFLPTVTGSYRCVVHFYLDAMDRCKIIDKHLRLLAKKHMGTRFVSINAERAPFFVEKIKIATIPSTVILIDGKAVHKILGLQGLPGDDFKTWHLGRVLSAYDGIEEDVESDEEYE